jgi:predicted O-methyltransferase YrrM
VEESTLFNKSLESLLREMEEYSQQNEGVYAIPREEGMFLNMLVRLQRPYRIIELGTSSGYSTIWLATAAARHGGAVDTVEYDADKVKLATENIRRAGLNETVRLHHADADDFLERLDGPVDFAFLDTEKADYLRHFKLLFPNISPGGLVAADNAVDLAHDMKDFLSYVKGLPSALSVTVDIGNGLELTCKL